MATTPRRRRFSLALLALALLFPIVLLAPATVPPAEAAASSITFEGGGWGHAVGLSQYGAYGMALVDGADAATILSHYYTGTSVAELGVDVPDVAPLWVNLLRRASSTVLRPEAIVGSVAHLTVTHNDTQFPAATGDAIRIDVVGSDNAAPVCRFTIADAVSEGSCFADIAWDGASDSPTTRVTIEDTAAAPDDPAVPCTNPDWNAIPTTFRPCSYAHGSMHVRPSGEDRLHLILEIDVDAYVEGISEMPYYWGNPSAGPNGAAALEAQAVAARSYAISRQIARGNPEDTNCWCDVVDTSADQRYVGWGHTGLGHETWLAAARSTAGLVLTHPDIGGGARPITAYYGSSSFGVTESGIDGFAQDIPYLQSVDDHWANDSAVRNPYSSWTKTLTGDQIADHLGIPDHTIVSAEIAACSEAGAALQVRFIDDSRTEHLRASRDLRALLGLRSPQITAIDGIAGCVDGESGGTTSPLLADHATKIRDVGGDSDGNGDWLAQCGETIELLTWIDNVGTETVTGISATISTGDPYLEVLYNTTSTFADIAPGQDALGADDWDIRIADSVPNRHVAELELAVVSDNAAATTLTYTLLIWCDEEPPEHDVVIALGNSTTIDDGIYGDSVGNNDRTAQCGETIELYVKLTNNTDEPIKGVSVDLLVDDPALTLLYNVSSDYPRIPAGKTKENSNDWDLQIDDTGTTERITTFRLRISTPQETYESLFGIMVYCEAGFLSATEVRVDDGPTGDSIGNGDGIAQCGETIELSVLLTNVSGQRPITDIHAVLTSQDPALTLLHNSDASYPDLEARAGAYNDDDWDLAIGSVADGHVASSTIIVRFNGDSEIRYPVTFEVECDDPAAVVPTSVTIDDGIFGDSVGNNNKIAECNELIELYVELTNESGADISAFDATLNTDDPYVTILYNAISPYAALIAGESAENSNDWDIQIADGAPNRHDAVFTLSIQELGVSLDVPVTLRCTG